MRKVLPFLSLFTAGLFALPAGSKAQQADRFAYAITDATQLGSNWSYLRRLNLQTGEYSQVILNGSDLNSPAYIAGKNEQAALQTDARLGTLVNSAFAGGVAAMAYDKKSNRLYYTPMLFDQLRYIDLKTMKVYFVTGKGFTGNPIKNADQGNIVTRMVIAPDGNGYALTNDATQLIRFGTGKKGGTQDLGTVVDDPANKEVSVHNACTSFGGDMIAGDDGQLYVFSARNHVFRINPETKVATHLGTIKGLPEGFGVNGAAVTDDNKIVLSSALKLDYFTLDHRNWTASPFTISGTSWNSSDLASSNLLSTAEKNTNTVNFANRNPLPNSGEGTLSIYPNPVTDNKFVVQFSQLKAGTYSLLVTDVMGRQVQQQNISISGENHAQTIQLDPAAAKGIYLVKVTDGVNRNVFTTKVVIQ